MDTCYCGNKLECEELNRSFKCEICSCFFHITCLKSQPSSQILGDIFFKFTCQRCNCTQGCDEETFVRMKLSWLQVIILSMYNLQESCHDGMDGHFKWKEHLCRFIHHHWNKLFHSSVKRTTKWHGTVAGVLSSHANVYFTSGVHVFKQNGWWKLMDGIQPDRSLLNPMKSKKRKQDEIKKEEEVVVKEDENNKRSKTNNKELCIERLLNVEDEDVIDVGDVGDVDDVGGDAGGDVGHVGDDDDGGDVDGSSDNNNKRRKTKKNPTKMNKEMMDGDTDEDLFQQNDTSSQDSSGMKRRKENLLYWKTGKDLTVEEKVPEFFLKGDEDEKEDDDIYDLSRMIDNHANDDEDDDDDEEDNDDDDLKSNLPPLDQLLSSYDDSRHQIDKQPTLPQKQPDLTVEIKKSDSVLMSRYEERDLLKRLDKLHDHCHLLPAYNKLKSKLMMRQRKRELGLPIFNIDSYLNSLNNLTPTHTSEKKREVKGSKINELLDRYQHCSEHKESRDDHVRFSERLVGRSELQSFKSPYTHKILKKYIRRDTDMRPMKLQLMQQIIAHAHRNDPTWQAPPTQPIDFVHVRPQFISAINQYCHHFFWPDIDLTDCLYYPDYSIVALYKNLVVAFAIMIPDVSVDESYLSFIFTHPEWRGAGIATFMLFYLLQLEPHKDVTLHVSVSNHSLLLYQHFSFKCEEFIVNFYDKYLPFESKQCRNAFYMRFKRFT